MNDKMKSEFDAAFVKKFGFGRMMASANADAHQMLNAAEWAWEAAAAPAPPQPIYDDAAEQEAFEAVNPMPDQVTKFKGGYAPTGYSAWDAQDFCKKWDGWKSCAQSRAKAGEDE